MVTEKTYQGKIGCNRAVVEHLFIIKAEEKFNDGTFADARVVLDRNELERFITKLQALLE